MGCSVRGWDVPHHYRLGDHAIWCGVDLVCTRDHYAGWAASHPWDPAVRWPAKKAPTLWTPNGPDEAAKLSAILVGRTADRLWYVLAAAVG